MDLRFSHMLSILQNQKKYISEENNSDQQKFGLRLISKTAEDEKQLGVNEIISLYRIFRLNGQEINLKPPTVTGLILGFSPDGKKVCGYSIYSYKLPPPTVWDVKSGRIITLLAGGLGVANAFSPDGRKVCGYSTDSDDKIYPTVWDVKSGRIITTFEGVGRALAFSPDGRKVYILI